MIVWVLVVSDAVFQGGAQGSHSMQIRISSARIFSGLFLLLFIGSVQADKTDLGLPACEQIIGVDRNIAIGNTVTYILEQLEKNNYRCGEFKGRINEVISCTFRLDHKNEILLTVEEGQVTDIDTINEGTECSYFNLLPKDPCKEDPFEWEGKAQPPGCKTESP